MANLNPTEVEAKIVSIVASPGGPSVITIDAGNGPLIVVTTSTIIQQALVPAILTQAKLSLILVEGSIILDRVYAYEPGPDLVRTLPGNAIVSRIATQRGNLEGDDEHLEAFVKFDGDPKEYAFNVYSPTVQNLLLAAFVKLDPNHRIEITAKKDPNVITAVRLGAP